MNFSSERFFYKQAVPDIDTAVNNVTKKFLKECRSKIEDKNNVRVMIDAGWSHPGWWARECTVIAVDGNTGLPLSIFNVLRDNNFEGSSKGNTICFIFILL